MDYSYQFLSRDQATSVLNCFKQAIVNVVDESTDPKQASLLDGAQLALLKQLNGPYPVALQDCIHTRVSYFAERCPAKLAIESFAGNLTYAQLDQLSSRLASHLQLSGAAQGARIPVCFEKTIWAAVAQLAILKSGACCVPLNAEHPIARLEDIVEQTSASVVITAPSCASKFAKTGCKIVSLDESLLENLPDATTMAPSTSSPHDLAFILFTSGSTGRPKGVELQHSALVTSANAHGKAMGIEENTRTLAFASWNYDVSIQDLWTTMQRGGVVCMVADEDRLDMARLTHTIETLRANWADLTPTVAALIDPASVPSLTTISLGGEAVPQSVLDCWQNAGRRVINGYGPAENSINSACSDAPERMGRSANIGRPLASHFYVTRPSDPDFLMPLGVVGELLIESPQLARGYLNEHEKTEAAFIKNPAWIEHFPIESTAKDRRFYRTGDLVRMQPNGTYVFVGRADRQVKIRGQRVELGEIESQLKLAMPSDLDVAVDMQKIAGHDDRVELVAYIDFSRRLGQEMPDDDFIFSTDEVLADLEATRLAAKHALPSHMNPNVLLPLRRFPLNPSGKLDFQRLRREFLNLTPDAMRAIKQRQSSTRAPVTNEEKALHESFCHLLRLPAEEISVEDSFLALGGDSILAMQLSRLMRERSFELSVQHILRCPKLCDLAEEITVRQDATVPVIEAYEPFALAPGALGPTQDAVKSRLSSLFAGLDAEDVLDVHPVTDLQARFARANASAKPEYVTCFTWTGEGELDVSKLMKSLEWSIARFDCLRSAFIELDAQVLQVVLRHSAQQAIQHYSTEEMLESFMEQLQRQEDHRQYQPGTPLARFSVVQHRSAQSSGPAVSIVLRMTHAQYDGATMDAIMKSVAEHFNNVQPSTSPLGQGPYMGHLLSDSVRSNAIDYWRQALRGTRSTTRVCSLDFYPSERGTTQSDQGFSAKLPASHLRTGKFTPATLFRACWARTLAEYDSNVVFADLASGREAWEPSERVAGCCIARYPIRFGARAGITYADIASSIRDQSAASIPHATLGWDTIAQECTEWSTKSKEAEFGSLVQYTDLSNGADEGILFGSTSMRHAVFDQGTSSGSNVILECEALGDEAEVSLFWQDDQMSMRFGQELVEKVVAHLAAASAELSD